MGDAVGQYEDTDLVAGDPSPLQRYCVAMQPICDDKLVHVADELLYRESACDTSVSLDADQQMTATARVCHIAFHEIGIDRLAGSRKVFVNAPREWLLKPELLPPVPGRVVIEVLESVAGEPEVLASLRQIRAMGFEVALDDFVLTPETKPLLEVADILKIDVLQPVDAAAVSYFKLLDLTLLAEKVEDYGTFETLRQQGFELFQGYFYARPETLEDLDDERYNNHAALMRLTGELHKEDADFKAIEDLIAQDPQLTMLLLKYANSAYFHYRGRIETIGQVLRMLGLKQVRNMAVTMLIARNGPASKLLLSRALTRARVCEHLAAGSKAFSTDAAFLAGLLSLMGEMLRKTLPSLLEELSLSPEIIDAVLHNKGALGELLRDVEAFESADTGGWAPQTVEQFNRKWLKSQVWATEILSMVECA